MKVKRGGTGKFGGAGRKEDGHCRKIQKSDCLLGNLDPFIASIYMKSRKILKERIRVVCCSCYGKGEHLEREVVKIAKVTTRGMRGVLRFTHCVCVIKGTLSLRVRRLRNHPLLLLQWAHRFAGNSALGRLVLPSFLYLHFRRGSRNGRGGPGACDARG